MTFSKVVGNEEKLFFLHLHILCKSYSDTLIMPIWQIIFFYRSYSFLSKYFLYKWNICIDIRVNALPPFWHVTNILYSWCQKVVSATYNLLALDKHTNGNNVISYLCKLCDRHMWQKIFFCRRSLLLPKYF